MSADRKIAEGLECVRLAEKCLKTSFMKWKPDYDDAASEYSKAATNFKNAKAYPQCKDCLLKAAECFRQNQSYFSAAKSIEQAALVSKDMGDLHEAANLVERASRLFLEHGTPDTAALSLEKGAKVIESKLPERALKLFIRASDVAENEGRPRQATEYLSKAARLQVKLKMFDAAVETIRHEMELHAISENRACVGRLVVALVILHLTRGDSVAADKAFKECASYVEDDEMQTLEMLLEAFDQEDADLAARALSSPFIKHMDVEYAKLARDLRIPGSLQERPRTLSSTTANTIQSPPASYSSREEWLPDQVSDNLNNLTLSPPAAQSPSTSGEAEAAEEAGASEEETSAEASKGATASAGDEDDDYEGGLC